MTIVFPPRVAVNTATSLLQPPAAVAVTVTLGDPATVTPSVRVINEPASRSSFPDCLMVVGLNGWPRRNDDGGSGVMSEGALYPVVFPFQGSGATSTGGFLSMPFCS